MPRLRLPPLPKSTAWSGFIPKGNQRNVGAGLRESRNRLFLASKPLADRFVRDLGIRKGEVVIDAYTAVGLLTRSLLAGGKDETTPEDWQKVAEKDSALCPPGFPEWNMKDVPPPTEPPRKENFKEAVRPALVIANDPSLVLLSKGLAFDKTLCPPSKWEFINAQDPAELARFETYKSTKITLHKSSLQENLVIAPLSVYHWPTISEIMTNPLVFPHLPVYDKEKKGLEATYRPWSAEPPHITMVSVMPHNVLGDQMLSQWISSAIGSDEYGRSWLWQWGRVRLALLLNKNQYDRIMAQPGETVHCKLSVMAQALFHLRPLTPMHHVPDVDKQSSRINTSIDIPRAGGRRVTTIAAPPPSNEVTKTVASDFYPFGSTDPDAPLDRPRLLGIELMPRKDTFVRPEQRDVWDYILRRGFVREAAKLIDIMPSIAFGAENLLPKIEAEDSPYAGDALPADTIIRNITVAQWARFVDVFDKWAFKPEMLYVDSSLDDNREVGQS